MKTLKIVFLLFLLYIDVPAISQGCSALAARVSPSPTSPPKRDTTVCKGSNLNIFVNIPTVRSTTSYTVATIPHIDTLPCESTGSLVAGAGITIDDGYSAIQNIGFNFCFFGSSHSQLQICDNGFLTFSVNKPVLVALTAPFVAQSLPLGANPNPASGATTLPPNSILGAWMDTYLVTGGSNPGGGTITAQLVGTAPFRAYIVKWNDCRYYNTTCRPQANMFLNMKIVLYETTNLIDVYIKTKPICSLSATNLRYLTTQGLQGDSIFKNIVTPGRNNTIWNGANSAVRFTPNGSVNTTTVQWTKNGTVIATTPIASITHSDDSANYVANVTYSQACPSGSFISRDTLKVYGQNINITASNLYDTITCMGSKSYNATNAGVLSYLWDNGSTNPIRTISTSGRYFVVRSYSTLGCSRDTVFYNIKRYESLKIDSFNRIGCFNSLANGQVRLFVSGDTTNLKLGTTSSPTQSLNPLLNQTRGTFTYWIRNGGNCRDSITVTHDSLSANYFKRVNFCIQDSSGLLRLTPFGGYAPYTFNLTGRASQTIDSFNKIIAGIYTIQVTDKIGCSIQRTDTIVPFTNLSLAISRDSAKCFGDSSGRIIVTLSGGKPGYFYSINNGSFGSSGVFNLLPVGSYIIKTKDAANCPRDTTITIVQYPLISTSIIKQKNCPFNTNGTVTISASGGNPSYEYKYNTGAYQSSSSFVNLVNSPFTISVRDRNNCIRIFQDTLGIHLKPDLGLIMKKNVSCYGFSDGKIRVNTTIGKSPFTYSWNIPGSADSAVNLPFATYTAFVSDSNGCKDTLLVQITQPDSLRASLNIKHPLCHLSSNGTIKVIPQGGTLPYQYSINASSFTSVDSFSGLIGAVYTIQIRDSQTCLKSYTRTLTNPSAIQLSLISDSVKCFGGSDGKIQFIASGGSPGYTYRINSLAYDTFRVKSSLTAANYTVSVKDTNGCIKDSSIQVYTYSPITMVKNILDTIRCKNGNDGRISITASGGKSPYTYSINGGSFQVSNIFPNLNVGKKFLRVKDAYNCEILDSIIITEPSGITSNVTVQKNVTCYGQSNAKAKVTVVGGIPPYSYLWSNGITLDSNITLNSGIRYVLITDTKNCKDSISFTITQPDSLHANLNIKHPLCHLSSNGTIKVIPQGGTLPYQYAINALSFTSMDSFSGLIGAVYTIQIRDSQSCLKSYTRTLTNPSAIQLSLISDSVKCFGGSDGKIQFIASGGSPGYTYRINSLAYDTFRVKSSLTAANYTVSVKDTNGCIKDSSIQVYTYSPITMVKNVLDSIRCKNGNDGRISITASGGKSPYTYSINGGSFQVSNIFPNLNVGKKYLRVRDANNCEILDSLVMTEPTEIIANVTIQKNVSCYGQSNGKAKVNVVGGIPPYTYLWSNTITIDSNTTLYSGNHNVVITDTKNCKDTINFTISQPDSLHASLNIKHPLCHLSSNGNIKVIPQGGTAPYQYSINSSSFSTLDSFSGLIGAVYTIQIRDNQSCLKSYSRTLVNPSAIQLSLISDSVKCFGGSDGKIQFIASGGSPGYTYRINSVAYDTFRVKSNLIAANYTVSVKDTNGCVKDSSKQVFSYTPIAMVKNVLDTIRCKNGNDGRISITASGGRTPYTYSINGGGFQTSNIFPNLNVGKKYLRVRDANNCEILDSLVMTEPTEIIANVTIQKNVSCYGQSNGKAKVNVVGGIPTYTYLWSNTITIDSNTTLNGGNHNVVITDTKNCKDTVNFTISQPDSLHASLNLYHPKCHNTLGSIKVKPTGGTTPYQYSINAAAFGSADSFANLAGTNYTIVVRDTNLCSKTFNSALITPTQLTATYKMDSIRCFGANTGKITVTYSGGTGIKTIRNNSVVNSGDTVKNLSVGNYLIEVLDANNCKVDSLVNVPQYPDILLTVLKDTALCYGAATASLTVNATGGAGGYTYAINSSAFGSSNLFTALTAGNQTVKVRDKYQCVKSQNETIAQIDSMTINTQITQNLCFKDSLGKVKFSITGGSPPYQITFNGSLVSGLDSFIKLPAGSFTYNVRDNNNCIKNGSVTITHPTPISSTIVIDSVKCYKQSTGSVIVNPTGGTPGYMISFNGQTYTTTNSFVSLTAGFYNIKIRDANLCVKDTNVEVKSSDSFYYSYTVDSIDCNNANNGKVTINPQGGKSPYQYSLNVAAYNSNNVISNLTPANHFIQIRDTYNCVISLNVSLANPSPIQIQIDSNISNLCFNESKGRLQISSIGGKLPHSYTWSNGSPSNRIVNLTAGNYTVTVRDAKNCVNSLTAANGQPNDFSITPNQTNLKCFGDSDGSINVSVSGATPSYDYLWSTGSVNSNISGLAAGNYSLTVRDANLCQTTRSYVITQPDSINFDLVSTKSHCAASKDGIILVNNLAGGSLPPNYSFTWSHGPRTMNVTSLEPFITYTLSVTDNNGCKKQRSSYIDTMYELRIKLDTLSIPRCPYSLLNLKMTPLSGTSPYEFNLGNIKNNTGDFTNQKNAKYIYKINDAFNCSFSDSIDLVPRDTMKISLILYPPSCVAANIFPVKAHVTGSKAPYVFDWPRAIQTIYDSARFNYSGYYEVKVKDSYDCVINAGFTLALPEGALHGVITEKKNLRCFNLNDGILKIEGRGGNEKYKYLWSTGDTTKRIQNLKATKYQVTIFDSDTCQYIMEDSLSQPDSLHLDARIVDKTCKESTNGKITLLANGGVPRYNYSIDSNIGFQRDSDFYFVNEGSYLATVRDDSFCQTSKSVNVDVKYKLSLTLDSVYYIKAGETVFIYPSLTLTPSSAFYIAEWTPGEGLSCTDCLYPEFNGYHTTLLNLKVKYGAGCIANFSTLVKVEGTQNDELYVPNAFSPSADNIENREFRAYANRVLRFEMSVFNRWGEKVFETDNIRIGWDGNYKGVPAPKGLYAYTLRLTKLDGIRIIKSGEVSLF